MAAEKVVIDASVVAKWFLEEVYSTEALRLRDKYISGKVELASPCIMPYEVLNALRYSGVYTKDALMSVVRSLERYGIELWDLRLAYGQKVAKVAMDLDITVYDASYVALAGIVNARLVTADEELVAKAKDLINLTHIRELK
ncbi:MAG: type II toxin-antitoxin system VapC family toxin [Methanomicrobia archaeon]|nr:type II toxin-antitoxin system VapC family toxin [Methanomicrobia archaeon]